MKIISNISRVRIAISTVLVPSTSTCMERRIIDNLMMTILHSYSM
jgi:hypothetical protein